MDSLEFLYRGYRIERITATHVTLGPAGSTAPSVVYPLPVLSQELLANYQMLAANQPIGPCPQAALVMFLCDIEIEPFLLQDGQYRYLELSDIEWEIDDPDVDPVADCGLPSGIAFPRYIDEDIEACDSMADVACSKASDRFGFLIRSFNIQEAAVPCRS